MAIDRRLRRVKERLMIETELPPSTRYADYLKLALNSRFDLVLITLRADVVAATRSYRQQNIHHGQFPCRTTMCDGCFDDVLMTTWEVFRRFENGIRSRSQSKFMAAIDGTLASALPTLVTPPPSKGLLFTLLANA